MIKGKSFSRAIAIVLALTMVLTLTPLTSFATESGVTRAAGKPFETTITVENGKTCELTDTGKNIDFHKWGDEDVVSIRLWECKVPAGTKSVDFNKAGAEDVVKLSDGYTSIKLGAEKTYALGAESFTEAGSVVIDRGYSAGADEVRYIAVYFAEEKTPEPVKAPFETTITVENGKTCELTDTGKNIDFHKWGDEDVVSIRLWECKVPAGTKSVDFNKAGAEDVVKLSDGYTSIKLGAGKTYALGAESFTEAGSVVIDRGYSAGADEVRYVAVYFAEEKSGNAAENIQKVIDAIDAIPALEAITFTDRIKVQDARHIYDLLNSVEKTSVTNYDKLVAAEAKIAELKAGRFTDGTFVGKGQGLKGDIVLKTTVKDGDIKSIDVIETHETPDLWRNTAHKVIQSIIDRNDTDVDTITGATFASNGIINATKDSLAKAEAYIGVQISPEVPASFTNDLWLQYDFKEMEINDEVTINPRRVEEAITDGINNNVELPVFHYEIIRGDSVTIDGSENAHAKVKAVKEGDSVVKVTYDALEHSGNRHFDAIDPVNVTYAVFSVGGSKDITVTDNIVYDRANAVDGKRLFRSYDTVYFAEGETVPFEINVSQTGGEKLEVFCNGMSVSGENGKYILPLENRSNIIEMTASKADGTKRSLYRVIDARKIDINIANTTNPDKPLRVGDVAEISFRGITMPVYKLATIYNPYQNFGWDDGGESVHVRYTCDGKQYKQKHGQYDIAENNSFKVKLEREGAYNFTNGSIYEGWYGDSLGSDKVKAGPGSPNMGAPVNNDDFCIMPDFSFNVEKAIDVTSLTLDKSELTLNKKDEAQLNAAVLPEDATVKTVTWSSDDNSVAKVDKTGKVTAIGRGETVIRAEAGSFKEECKVKVNAPEAEKIEFTDKNTVEICNGQEHQFEVVYTPSELFPEEKGLTWKSSNEKAATVDKNGKVTATGEGRTTITAEIDYNSKVKTSCDVVVKPFKVSSIKFTEPETEVKEGTSKKLGFTFAPAVTDEFAKTLKYTWSSSDENVAVVKDGVVVPIAQGTCNITLKIQDKTATCKVTVTEGAGGNVTAVIENKGPVYSGDTLSVSVSGLNVDEKDREYVYYGLKFDSTLPGLKTIKSENRNAADLFPDKTLPEKLTFEFKIPENTPAGTYYMSNGELTGVTTYFPQWGWIEEWQNDTKGKLPVIKVVISEKPVPPATVTFRLIGDTKHDGFDKHEKYVTWIATKSYTVDENTTAYEIFTKAIAEAGLEQEGAENNYIKGIKAPASLGGYWLREMSNGRNSGWMYTVNGVHVNKGIKEYTVKDGDKIIVHYVDDYTKESSFEGSNPEYPDRWLEAEDVNPPETPADGEEAKPSDEIKADTDATVKDGEASSEVKKETVDKVVEEAKKNPGANVVIDVKGAEKADKVTVTIEKKSAEEVAKSTTSSVEIKTPAGSVKFTNTAFKDMTDKAAGNKLEIVVEKKAVKEETKKLLGDNAALTSVTVVSNGEEIHTFGGHHLTLTFNVPSILKDKAIAAVHVAPNGKLEKLAGMLQTIDKKQVYVVTIDHLSDFALAEEAAVDDAIKAQNSEKNEKIRAGVKATKITMSSKRVKGGIKVTWKKTPGYRMDGYEVHRSVKKYSGFGKNPYFKTKGTSYKNTKQLKKGTRYYYKVRGFRMIDGEKVYTPWSTKAYRLYK